MITATSETHIASLVVHCRPEHAPAVADLITGWPGAEISMQTPEGKLVVILETHHEADILTAIDRIHELHGVLNVSLVFHHAEATTALDETVDSEGEPL